ncbi:MAG: zinc ribbon domain-containing protein [Clostridia bacterium]|nr:zinc ribbon domain-containing protein [Clostridia bacterium]MBR6290644.1 zinc ribbon domain-containing protein [Clostridia bacterium]
MARFCPNCGAQVDDNAPFCPNCGAKQAAAQAAPQQVAPQQAAPQQVAPPKQPVDLSFLKKAITNPLFILGAIICGIVAFFIKLTPIVGTDGFGANYTAFFVARMTDKTALYVFMMIFLIIMVCTTGWLAFKHFLKRNVTVIDMCFAFFGFFLMFLITVIAFPVLGGVMDPTKSYPNVGGWILLISEIAGLFFTAFPAIKGIVKKN